MRSSERGYIAITSTLLISIILMMIVFGTNYTGYLNRFNILLATSKETSRSLAEACVAKARLKLATDISYSGNEIITVGDRQCTIVSVENGLPPVVQKIIKAKALVNNAVTNLKVTVNIVDLSAVSWEEVENF